jgi:hypothetical protein
MKNLEKWGPLLMVEPDDELKSKCQNPNAKEMSKFRNSRL